MENFQISGSLVEDPAKIFDSIIEAETQPHRACVCGTLLSVEGQGIKWFSGIVNYKEVLCDNCRSELKDNPKIVCIGCKTLQGYIPPQKHPSGFEYKRRTHYHIDGCPKCKVGVIATPVLELTAWCRGRGLPMTTDPDIVKESEQKSLRGAAESARVIASLRNDETPRTPNSPP